MTTKERAEALVASLDIDVLDAIVPLVLKESLQYIDEDYEDKKLYKAMKRVHNYYSLPQDRI